MLGLGAGFGIQSLGRRLDDPDRARGPVLALIVLAAGMDLAAAAAHTLAVWVSLLAAIVLGCGYGMAMIAGLLEVQRIAGPHNLAGLTAVFYSVTYLGFAVPVILAWISENRPAITYTAMFGVGVIAALVCLAIVVAGHRADRRIFQQRPGAAACEIPRTTDR